MKKVRNVFALLVTFMVIASFFCVVYAEGEEDVVTLGDYEEFENLYNSYTNSNDDSTSTEGPTQEQLKEEYNAYNDYLVEYYSGYVREKPIKATVLKADTVREEYEMSYDYSVSKYRLQKVTVRIDEGTHKGKEVETDYVLSADTLDNIILSELHVGDKVFVMVTDNGNGTISANISNSWATVQRFNMMICIGIIILLLALIYAGRKGLSASLIAVVIVLSTVVIIPSFAFAGAGIVWTSVLISILLIIAISMAHLGLNGNTIKAIGISAVFALLSVALAAGFSYITRTVGTIFEHAAISENIILGNINFYTLYLMGVLVIASGVVANAVATYINKINRENVDSYNDKIELCKEGILSNIVVVSLVGLTLYIPNQILLLANKFGSLEIMNSETLVSEFIRLFSIIIPTIMAAPVVSLDFFKFGKKYIEEAKNSDSEKEEIDE